MVTFTFAGDLASDPPEAAALWEAGCRGMQQQGDRIVAWFDDRAPLAVDGVWADADDTDWLERYHRELQPVEIGTLVVAPTHRTVTLRAGQQPLWLDPGTAFGTGHHETTRMALAALDRTPLEGARVLDVGSGSGILAIAADRLGARRALGLDIDAATVPVARENARRNRSRARFAVGTLDPDDPEHACDVLVANLFAELHVRLARDYARAVRPGGTLLLTGILDERAEPVRRALPAAGLRIQGWTEDGAWRLVTAVRP